MDWLNELKKERHTGRVEGLLVGVVLTFAVCLLIGLFVQ